MDSLETAENKRAAYAALVDAHLALETMSETLDESSDSREHGLAVMLRDQARKIETVLGLNEFDAWADAQPPIWQRRFGHRGRGAAPGKQ